MFDAAGSINAACNSFEDVILVIGLRCLLKDASHGLDSSEDALNFLALNSFDASSADLAFFLFWLKFLISKYLHSLLLEYLVHQLIQFHWVRRRLE